MTKIDQSLVKAPKGCSLGLMSAPGEVSIIPLGATLLLIEDPNDAKKVTPWLLKYVGRREIVLKCPCGQKTCNREMRLVGKYKGVHPQKHIGS